MMVRQLKVTKALPVLEARLRSEHLGFGGFARETLEATINELKNQGSKPNASVAAPAQAKTVAELEKQLADLQKQDKRAQQSNRRPQTEWRSER